MKLYHKSKTQKKRKTITSATGTTETPDHALLPTLLDLPASNATLRVQ
jgi:hypothetical protein